MTALAMDYTHTVSARQRPEYAYWVCITTASALEKGFNPTELLSAMDYQKSYEEGSDVKGSVVTNRLPGLRPLAPIQFTDQGQLVDQLFEVFGPAAARTHVSDPQEERPAVAVVWSPAALMTARDPHVACRDQRAADLFQVARHRAAGIGAGLLVVFRAHGESDPIISFNQPTQDLMRDAGFILTNRMDPTR